MAHVATTIRYVAGATAMHWSALASEDHDLCKDRVLILTLDAVAAKLGKKLLLVNFPMLQQQTGRDSGSKYQSIF